MRKVSNVVYQDDEEFNDHDYVENSETQNTESNPTIRVRQKLKKKGFNVKKTNNDNVDKVRRGLKIDLNYDNDDYYRLFNDLNFAFASENGLNLYKWFQNHWKAFSLLLFTLEDSEIGFS